MINKSTLPTKLEFSELTPIAPRGLGGLLQDIFANGRICAKVGWHGGLIDVLYWGQQHLRAPEFFSGNLGSGYHKLFCPCVGLGENRYYLPLKNTKLYPFGLGGESRVIGVDFKQELLLLPDALVQRFEVLSNPKKLPVFIEMFHNERFCAVKKENRKWSDFEFNARLNAIVASCLDENPEVFKGEDCLSQSKHDIVLMDAPHATTWIGVGCDSPMKVRCAPQRFKLYLTSEPNQGREISFFVVFANSREKLMKRLGELSKNVHQECQELVSGYERRLLSRPQIDVGNPVLNSAFSQYPEVIHHVKVHDRPGALRGALQKGFVWGWDGMTPFVPTAWANESDYTAQMLKFFHETLHPRWGIPLEFTTAFELRLYTPFPAQAQYIAGLYHYIAITGDWAFAREVLPTCQFILDRCREHLVKDTGLVSWDALWPDFPEEMEEDGNDINSLNNSLLYQGLRSLEYIFDKLEDAKSAKECCEWAKRLRASFVKYLYDEEKGYFISSCSSKDFKPRKHYCCQAVFWLTPFARELVSHAPGRISSFMDKHLRSEKCLLSLPKWDTAWMQDGNQLGSSFPAADYLYVNVHKEMGNDYGLKTWLGDVEWFWRHHTAPEAFTPEAENEDERGPDNHGCKQIQAVSTWYGCLYNGIAGLDADHEGITLTPWSDIPVNIRGLRLRGTSIDLKISGRGRYIGSLKLNGKSLPAGSRKIAWKAFKGKTARLELVRSEKVPSHPVIVRADGLRVKSLDSKPGKLSARIEGDMSGEVVVQVRGKARVKVNGAVVKTNYEPSTSTITLSVASKEKMELDVVQ